MSYLPSPYTGYYTRVNNTVVSGSELLSYLKGSDVRMLEFDSATHSSPPLATQATGFTQITVPQLIDASISSLPIEPHATLTGYIYLGLDTQSQAAAYCSLFNLASTNDTRTLRFYVENPTNVFSSTYLTTNSSTSAYVKVICSTGVTATSSATTSNVAPMFLSNLAFVNPTGNLNWCSAAAGSERIVSLYATNVNSGAQVVVFNILGGSL
jgi:hypothetical protein